ncbi:MAG: universal stress protein [Desulfopila sp.]
MINCKKIVAAIDGSEHSDKIVDTAIEYSTMAEAKIILVYCHRKFSPHMGQLQMEKEIPLIKKESQQLLDPYIERLQKNTIEVEQRLMEEPAGEVIADIATIEKCDLIIMGSRGLTNLAGLIVGSVTNQVLQTAPCSVLVVK